VIVEPNEVPSDVITMNSRADLVDLETGEAAIFTVVFPQEFLFRRGEDFRPRANWRRHAWASCGRRV
jgi:hypothetical protein